MSTGQRFTLPTSGGTLCSVVCTGNGVLKERHTHLSTGQRYTYPSHTRWNPLFCGFHRERGPERTTHPFEHRPKIYLPFPRPGKPFVLWFAQGSGLKERHTHLSTGQQYTYPFYIGGNPLFCGFHREPKRKPPFCVGPSKKDTPCTLFAKFVRCHSILRGPGFGMVDIN